MPIRSQDGVLLRTEVKENTVQTTEYDSIRNPGKVKNITKIFTTKESDFDAVNPSVAIEAARSELALYQHDRYHGGYEGTAPGCLPAGHGKE